MTVNEMQLISIAIKKKTVTTYLDTFYAASINGCAKIDAFLTAFTTDGAKIYTFLGHIRGSAVSTTSALTLNGKNCEKILSYFTNK